MSKFPNIWQLVNLTSTYGTSIYPVYLFMEKFSIIYLFCKYISDFMKGVL
jgi:hypothetical protein